MDKNLIHLYLHEAIENQRQGKKFKPQKKPLIIPEELQKALGSDTSLAESYKALNLTNKRDFADYISEAKRSETKQKRLEKIIPMIAQEVGLIISIKNKPCNTRLQGLY